ncbi:MAG: PHP domain-containing protein [Clostridiales bacterium]|nr:PHP domain-containing protein [Clostridiales bacterium]
MREWCIDLHMHSPLSPCAEDSMLPERVVARALDYGYDVIAITDHNGTDNARVFCEAGKDIGLIVVPGMEMETQEGIHLVCLFETVDALMAWDESLQPYKSLMKNDSRYFGHQWVITKSGDKLHEVEQMLLASTELSIDEAIPAVHQYKGLCIAAHADRQAYSVTGVLGVIPEHLPFDGIELTRHLPRDEALLGDISRQGYRYITSSDAHDLDQIGEIHCAAYLDHWSLGELALAMKGREGRDIIVAR